MRVTVIGAGVIGLTTALALQDAGHDVHILTEQRSPLVTSSIAAAIWFPYLVNQDERATRWGKHAYEVFRNDVAFPVRGVRWMAQKRVLFHGHEDLPEWTDQVDSFTLLPRQRDGSSGYAFDTPIIDTSYYLRYLEEQFARKGGQLSIQKVERLDDLAAQADLLVNCTGLAARELANDSEMFAVRGQIVCIERKASIPALTMHEENGSITYIIPRLHDIVLGGTSEEGNESVTNNREQISDILARCYRLVPELQELSVLKAVCGLRPARRSGVRLEKTALSDGTPLIHNYGHGGSGITLSWGCAQEVVQLAHHS